ncbi:YibE/F family protein [Cellulomonas bogoriensis]|uniref:YibE/F family protein n=1 Tax=Cellulomonas bogoriensis 69B4 = DSM 16987 TaxID=1386082 RepID=A0A0A0C2V2_9CELL|nr:YibE/F family protein [Cellulomonas bogoriensis]KGM14312.1 YibE/F family protein [Cellulomonas bogoriensis 69B4 = DSM 16987]
MSEHPPAPVQMSRTTAILLAVLLPLGTLTVVGLMALWPTGERLVTGIVDVETEYPTAVVETTVAETCAGTGEDRRADGSIPGEVACTLVTAQVDTGDAAGRTVEVWAPATVRADEVPAGTRIVLARYVATADEPEVWAWQDFARGIPLTALAVAFAVVVTAVAGFRGIRALIGLALAFVVIAVFMIPALLEGRDPLMVGLTGSSAIMFVVLYLAHGFSRRTTAALLGTMAGLGVTAVLGVVAAHTARLTGISTEEGYRLAMLTGNLDGQALRGLFLCGVVLAGLGVLNDVTITQASAVWELRAADPNATRTDLFKGGMRIGRDHIASTVYTIAFAYAGAALPILLLLNIYQMPLGQTLGSGEFAEEIARTLVGSIGLVLAIPLTTAIAALVVTREAALQDQGAHGHGHGHAGFTAPAAQVQQTAPGPDRQARPGDPDQR